MKEQRTLPRWKTNKQVNVRIQEEDYSNCVLEDINLNGMCLGLPKRLSQAGLLKLGLELSDGMVVDLNVQVPWVKKMVGYYKHGIVLYQVKEGVQTRINKYISQYATQD